MCSGYNLLQNMHEEAPKYLCQKVTTGFVVGTFAVWTHMPLDVLAAWQLHMSPLNYGPICNFGLAAWHWRPDIGGPTLAAWQAILHHSPLHLVCRTVEVLVISRGSGYPRLRDRATPSYDKYVQSLIQSYSTLLQICPRHHILVASLLQNSRLYSFDQHWAPSRCLQHKDIS